MSMNGELHPEFAEAEFVGELEAELGEAEFEGEFEGEFHEGEGEFELEGELQEGELEGEAFLGKILGALTGEAETGLSEAQELELATELIGTASEAEFEQFLGKVFSKVVRGASNFIKSPAGRALGGVLKSVAKKALPIVGGAVGSWIAPGVGTALGSKLGSMASNLFELELEGVAPKQAQLQVARKMVQLAASSARQAAGARPRASVSPRSIANAAVARAARAYAPGVHRAMLRSMRVGCSCGMRPRVHGPGGRVAYAPAATYAPAYALGQSGRWIRRGRKIVVLGA